MDPELKKKNLIIQLSLDFAVSTVAYCDVLDGLKKWSLSNQLLR